MTTKALRRWSWVHTWSSIVSMIFMLLLCVTGLPLLFHHEIDELLHDHVEAVEVAPGTPKANLDLVVKNGMTSSPGEALHFLIWDRDDPNVIFLSAGKSITSPPQDNHLIRVDAHTGSFLDKPDFRTKFTYIMLKLHTDMYAGLPGKLFLGLMGLLMVAAIISGYVLYAPSMRKLDFGTVRNKRSRTILWLDVHNLVGIVTAVWLLVVGFTGVLNTWADLVIKFWQFDQLAEMVGPSRDKPVPQTVVPVQSAVDTAIARLPDMIPSFVAYPGTLFTSKTHYAIFMRGNTPVTSRLLQPVLIDAASGTFTDTRKMPWYVSTLLLSQPLHFGDYGGLPLRIIWAILDVLTIVVLVSGIYLWLVRRRAYRNYARRGALTASPAE